MVKSEHIYSPQGYLDAVTGKCYIITGDNDIEFIEKMLERNGYGDELWNYPLSEIDHIVANELNVVLVDCVVANPVTDELENVYRWFEVPADFTEEN